MADDKLFPYQARVPVTADGALPSVDLLQFLNKIFKRIGEFSALTNVQLEALADSQASDIAAALQAANDAQDDADTANAGVAAAGARLDDLEDAVDLLELAVVTTAKGRFIYG